MCSVLNLNRNIICASFKTSIEQRLLDAVYDYARENLAKVHIYIQAPVVTKIVRDQGGGGSNICISIAVPFHVDIYHCIDIESEVNGIKGLL